MARTMAKHVHHLLQQGLDLLFPPHCAGCRRVGHLLCPACIQTMQPQTALLCRHCGALLPSPTMLCDSCQGRRSALHGIFCVSLHQGPLRNAIHALKYEGQQRLAEPLGLLLAQAFLCSGLDVDGMIPLPLHRQREQERGYNQSTLLARVCTQHLNVPCLDHLIIRQRATRIQVGLNIQERQQNVAGAFTLAASAFPNPRTYRKLVLIDDVCTTGATLEACAATLYTAGVEEVWGLVLARPKPAAR